MITIQTSPSPSSLPSPPHPQPGLHELDALQAQEVKDFRSKMLRVSEARMQFYHTMTWSEWLQACFSPQMETTGVVPPVASSYSQEEYLKITIHFDQSQVSSEGAGFREFKGLMSNNTLQLYLSVCV